MERASEKWWKSERSSFGTPSRINCQVFILSKFNRCLGDFHSRACSSRSRLLLQVLKSTLFSLARFSGGKWELWISRDSFLFYWFSSVCLVRSAFNLASRSAARTANLSHKFPFESHKIIYLFHELKGAVYFYHSHVLSHLYSRQPSRCEVFAASLVFVCERLHRSIALINQWFIGRTYKQSRCRLLCPKTEHMFTD